LTPTALASFVVVGKAIDWAFSQDGPYKLGEKRIGSMEEPAVAAKDGVDAPGNIEARDRPLGSLLSRGLEDGLELVFAFRGIGWDFGRGMYVPAPTRPQERDAYLRATLRSFILNFIALDFIDSCLKLVPGVGSVDGGSIYLSHLPPLQRYAVAMSIHFSTGCALLTGFWMVYDLCTLVAVGALHHSPSSWPPVMDNPWVSTSLHEFWARRWHQLLRQTFLVFGGRPGRALAGNVGLVLGAFTASGLFHELSMYAMGRGGDARVPLFFFMQGCSLIGERVWRRITGRRVGGLWGAAWVYFDIVVLGQPLCE
jgi:hypothetical protein